MVYTWPTSCFIGVSLWSFHSSISPLRVSPGVMLQWRAVYYNFLPKMFGFGLLSGNCEWHDGVYSWPTNQQYHMTKRVRVASIVLGWLVTPLHQYADCYWADVAERNQKCLKRSLMPLILALGLFWINRMETFHILSDSLVRTFFSELF